MSSLVNNIKLKIIHWLVLYLVLIVDVNGVTNGNCSRDSNAHLSTHDWCLIGNNCSFFNQCFKWFTFRITDTSLWIDVCKNTSVT